MSKRSVGLDVLRATCVTGVLATHFSPFFLGTDGVSGWVRNALSLGSFGVTGFFLLSAYLLTSILLREVGGAQDGIWKRYWIRRSLRIWPLYYLVLAAVVIGSLMTATRVAGLPWLATFTYNWASWQDPNSVLSHFWSMCAEEQLYVLIPILSFVAFRWRWPILAALIVAAPVARWLVQLHFPYPAVWNFTTSHLDVFAIGVLLASLDGNRGERWQRIRSVLTGGWWGAVVAGALALVLIAAAATDPQWVFGSGAAAWTYLAAAVVWGWALLKMTSRPSASVTPATRGAVWMGQRSYGIYVYHWPIVLFGAWLASVVAIPPAVIGLVLLAVVLVVSEASFRWIESPFLRLKSRFSSDPATVT